jgi:hypothetical protein
MIRPLHLEPLSWRGGPCPDAPPLPGGFPPAEDPNRAVKKGGRK